MSTTSDALRCLHCGRVNDAHERRPGERPKSGDVSLCWGCAGIALFTDDGLRLPTESEAAAIEADPELIAARTAIRAAAYPSQAIGVLWGSS